MRPSRHVFVCVHERPAGGKPSCGARGGREVLERLETALAARPSLWSTTSVTATACLGPCFDGPNLVVYPESCWYAHVAPADVDELVAVHLESGRPLARLLSVEED